MKLYKTVSG